MGAAFSRDLDCDFYDFYDLNDFNGFNDLPFTAYYLRFDKLLLTTDY